MPKPEHIAVGLDDVFDCCRKNNIQIDQGSRLYFNRLLELLNSQVKSNIPIFTVYLLSEGAEKTEDFVAFCDQMSTFFEELCRSNVIIEHKIKISVFGKWYKLPGKLVESLKKAIDDTKEHDSFFANFCINYDGQEEIVDACKLIAKQVELGKLDPEMVNKGTIKENLYSSYFLPPDILLIYGKAALNGLLLWDSVNSKVVFANKSFMDFDDKDIQALIFGID